MNGSWRTGELLVLHQGQQQQQQHQQRAVVEEQRQPPNSPTTPVWRIVDRIVKEEPPEDKNNDSGVSPGHYTSNSASPRSRRSSSTANCSLSPGSVTSQDSNVMQSSTFEYSPQRFFKSCDSPLEFPRLSTMDETSSHQLDQNTDLVSGSIKRMSEDAVVTQDNFQCPICAFTSINRLQFSDHLMSHCTANCDTPEFAKVILSRLASQTEESNWTSPSQGDPSEHDSEEMEEPGLRVPRINSQGKVKTFRCKHCEFVAITKVDFWEHGKSHIKADKLLACPKCPFVTEHKHHLEYHLRNHYGSKPFKCDKCSYVCVNKSMLNSHLKSHSNVYQYRCANCTYATKYCHSLKLHLRKYMHQPDMVLNADGSPNPLPIIDVYGTRRGPKQKSVKMEDPRKSSVNLAQPAQIVGPPRGVSPVSHSPLEAVSPISGLGQVQNSMMAAFPFGQVFGGFTLPNQFVLTDDNKQLEQLKSKLLLEYIKALNGDKIPEDFSQFISKAGFGTVGASNGTRETNETTNGTSVVSESVNEVNNDIGGGSSSTVTSINVKSEVEVIETKAAPLDLSKSENSAIGPSTNSSKATGTRRRKGKAVKLNRRVLEEDEDDDDIEGSFEPATVRTR